MLKTALRFGLIALALLILFQLSNASLFIPSISADAMIGIGAVILIALGIYLGNNFKKSQVVEVEVPTPAVIDHERIQHLGISQRELEVLELISEGLSNQEIGERLFLSESTIKSHVSNLFVKLDVKRRTQAVTRAKAWQIIA